jgi:lysophospholipase L1-like esterase
MKKLKSIFLFLFLCTSIIAQQGKPAFYDDIRAFKIQDSLRFPPGQAILFVGSSSFTKWTDVQDYFPGFPVINRGFGGSTLTDLIRYAGDIIIPYHPKQIVIYCGENDLAYSETVTAEMVAGRFEKLFGIIRKNNPAAGIVFISLKPSPSREKLWPEMVRANNLIREFLKTKKKTSFIDVYHNMFNKDGTIMKDIFLEDDLHMNKKGYRIWQKLIQPHLMK